MTETKKTKRSPREIIESEKEPKYESVYVKATGSEMVQLPTERKSTDRSAVKTEYIDQFYDKHKKPITYVHTHPPDFISKYLWPLVLLLTGGLRMPSVYAVTPSKGDLEMFLKNKKIGRIVIAQRNSKTGEIGGYLYVRKPKGYRAKEEEVNSKLSNYNSLLKDEKNLSGIMKEFGLKYKLLPAEGYELNSDGLARFEKKKKRRLEGKVATGITGLSFLASILLLSSNLTGFTISNLNLKTSNIIGITLFIIGLIGTFYYFKKKGAI